MKTKHTILFFAAIILLLVCEYLFLTELIKGHRLILLFLFAIGVIFSSLVAIRCYMRSGKDIA